MKIPLYQVDAFARQAFTGNPAAVCPLESWLYDRTLAGIAADNCVPATAFIVPRGRDYEIRWFTPHGEIALCGHGTLAAGWAVLSHLDKGRDEVRFASKSGELSVTRNGERFAMALPRLDPTPRPAMDELAVALGAAPRHLLAAMPKLLAVFDSAAEVAALEPDFRTLAALKQGVIATAPGEGYDCDFVSRYFTSGYEDPVTGSAHCVMVPYWAAQLGRDSLFARQISQRGGELWCELSAHDVTLSGHVRPYLVGEIDV